MNKRKNPAIFTNFTTLDLIQMHDKFLYYSTILLFSSLDLQAGQEVSPNGELLFVAVGIVLLVTLVTIIMIRNEYQKRRPGIALRARLFYAKTREKEPKKHRKRVHVAITNHSSLPIEIKNPVIVFESSRKKREFEVRSPGQEEQYPLLLGKKVKHEFRVDLKRFFQYDAKLKKYSRLRLRVVSTEGEVLAEKGVRI
jgi:hypothetical protein